MRCSPALLLAAISIAAPLPCSATEPRNAPEALLAESFAAAKARSDRGDDRIMAALRLAVTFRLAGKSDAAAAALEECLAQSAKAHAPDEAGELRIDVARELALLGRKERAQAVIAEIHAREYDTVAWWMMARALQEKDNAAGARAALERGLAPYAEHKRKPEMMGNGILCAMARLANSIGAPELAEQCRGIVTDPVWHSALNADGAVAAALAGNLDEALRTATDAPDRAVRTLALAHIAIACKEQPESLELALDRLRKELGAITSDQEHDFALRFVLARLAATGLRDAGAALAQSARQPSQRVLAEAPFVTRESFAAVQAKLDGCPETERPLLAEELAICAGARGLPDEALAAAKGVPAGWAKVRALVAAVRKLPSARKGEALVSEAAREAGGIADPAWRTHARAQAGLAAYRTGGASGAAEGLLTLAAGDALSVSDAEQRRGTLLAAIEAALFCNQKALAAKTLRAALAAEPSDELRSALVPLLIDAGEPEAAMAECAKRRLGDPFSRGLVAYRLARAGKIDAAAEYARGLEPRERGEALTEVARAQLPAAPSPSSPTTAVGLTLHGGWIYWMSRLERAGLAWDVMPLAAPYELGEEGLAERYRMLGFPGTGGHLAQVSVAGSDHIRAFVAEGGGLFGICAGQLFASGHPTGHRFVPVDWYYLRGQGPHEVLTQKAHPIALSLPPRMIISRMNGDFLLPRAGSDVIGWYDGEQRCAAVLAANYGNGRVIVSSPHPESGAGYDPNDRLCLAAIHWAIDGTP